VVKVETFISIIFIAFIRKMITLEEAKREVQCRQRHLEEKDFGELARYVSDVVYSSESPRDEYGITYMATYFPKRGMFLIPGGKSQIWVYASAYEAPELQNDDDFDSFFKDHEGFHAKQGFYLNPNKIITAFQGVSIHDKREAEAYAYQLARIKDGTRDVSPALEAFVRLNLNDYSGQPNKKRLKLVEGVLI
jgi:hypothetical protein